MVKRKLVGFFELSIMILAIFSFAYLVSPDSVPVVSAQSDVLKGCCLETVEGAICQDIPLFQSNLCKSGLVGTSCSVIDQCKLGCCYSSNSGTCAMRAPKEQCLANGGNWSNDASCNIPQCQLGCCVMGDQVALTNSRECTLRSNQFNFEKNFIQISPGQSCEQYVGLEKQGACLSDSGDFSGEKNCVFTTRKNCRSGEFVEDYLCTSRELNSVCVPSQKTTCVDGKDQVYFLDSCGNVANVYDASKVNDQSYWERPIAPASSCSSEGVGCGNCNYVGGSICVKHEQGVTSKPTYGDYTCKSLHCGERKHGESWCVYDFNPNAGIAPVGSRHFKASCFEGKISLEGCADFMQEICAQSTDTSFGFTEAKCLVNDWRSCINANDAESYSEVQKKCEENPQCIMFNEMYGEDNLKRSDGEFFAGFDPEKTNEEQGSIGDLGKDQNKVLAHCVPRFTPGFQFWTTTGSIVGSGKQQKSSANYGGSNEETSAICSLGSFSCVSKTQRKCELSAGLTSTALCFVTAGISSLVGNPDCKSWYDVDNWECNINGVTTTITTTDLPALIQAMNERCRALGTCGTSTNLVGSIEENSTGFKITRVKIDKSGKQKEISSEGYVLSGNYISSIKKSITPFITLNQIKSGSEGLIASDADTVGTVGEVSGGVIDLKDLAKGADVGQSDLKDFQDRATLVTGLLGLAGWQGLSFFGGLAWTSSAWIPGAGGEGAGTTLSTVGGGNFFSGLGSTLSAAAIGATIGYAIGTLVVKNNPQWSPGRAKQFLEATMGVGAAVVAIAYTTISMIMGGSCSTGPVGCLVGAIIAAAYALYEGCIDDKFKENEYYLMTFTCEAWQPPKGGDCSVCNDDVRPCSEYRCKSLGSNCHYFIENGEPGYCAGINEIWSAQIKPWQAILTSGNQYASVKNNGFRIQGSLGSGVEAWNSLTFGITTDKPASCKIDFEHTKDYSEMKYEMFSSVNPDTGKAEGTHHQVELNAFAQGSSTTLGLTQGEENEYYIRCMNFAGQVNEAQFVVQIKVKDGPDLTPPNLKRFSPEAGSYLKQGANSTEVILYLNEPAECRFDYEYDAFSGQEYFTELRHEMFCLTSPQSAFFGEWRCFANLENLTVGENNLYFRCKDQPDLQETASYPRNANFISTNYKLNVCSTGLDISLSNPTNLIEESSFTLSVSTSGCLGDAVCSFRMMNYSDSFNTFFETGGRTHSQLLTLPQGNHEIDVRCEDEARNVAQETFNFTVYFDETPPQIVRVINNKGEITVLTDEPAECMYETNVSIGCGFEFESEIPSYLSTEHKFSSNVLENYFIKCRDKKLNLPLGCSIIMKPIRVGRE